MNNSQTARQSVALPFAAIVLAMLPAVLDQTILATGLPTIAADLGRLSDVSWLATAYVVVAAATIVGPLVGGLLVQHVGWRWVFYVNLPVGAAALAGLHRTLPAPRTERPAQPLDALGAGLIAGATSTLMLTCVWGGNRYPWGSREIVGLLAATVLLGLAAVVRERRAADPIVPL